MADVPFTIWSLVLSFNDNDEIDIDEESLEIDLCSSSLLDGETGNNTRFNKDIDRSSGEPELKDEIDLFCFFFILIVVGSKWSQNVSYTTETNYFLMVNEKSIEK